MKPPQAYRSLSKPLLWPFNLYHGDPIGKHTFHLQRYPFNLYTACYSLPKLYRVLHPFTPKPRDYYTYFPFYSMFSCTKQFVSQLHNLPSSSTIVISLFILKFNSMTSMNGQHFKPSLSIRTIIYCFPTWDRGYVRLFSGLPMRVRKLVDIIKHRISINSLRRSEFTVSSFGSS